MLFKSAMLIAIALLLATLAFGVLRRNQNAPAKPETVAARQEAAKADGQNAAGNEDNPQATAKERDDAATPVVDLVGLKATAPLSPNRTLKNSRYDNQGMVKSDIDPRTADVVREPPAGISDFPANSDLVVEGTVTESTAFLSNDKGAVYSELAVQVSDVLKQSSDLDVKNGDSITTERFGGRVKYPDGKVVRYGIVGQGSPAKGKKYLFFLSRTEQGDYSILTAYEIQGDKVQPLDGSRITNRGLGNWAVDKHNDEDYQSFRKAVEQAVKNSPSTNESRRFNP
jgi:hypothetical protein